MAGGIPERRVRPVWDAIDSRQLKNALKLSTALLSKYPNSSYALVFCGNGGEKLLQLAEGLLKKHIASHSLHEPEALIVYISLLEQQAKYRDALEVLSGNLGSLIMIEVDKLRIQGRLLAWAGDYDEAANIFQKVLKLW
ncbi:hypothetical protein L1987_63989 [Smallanthus sonchifolius]|uniref:Uncharacterized protein n=1 Tax=Smallanthus sonchifolius TaxID=185202 RepID=A0ACB9CEP1_9ASTR|nr:hypothetical protein L1987_63989 [Smallanthus sonchifolius]